MAEVNQPGSPTPPAAPAAPAPAETLSPTEQVYKEFNIEAEAQSFNPQSPQPAKATPQAPLKVPDPFDPNFASYQAQMAQGVTSLNEALKATREELGTLRQSLHNERTEADIKKAVGTIAEESGLDPKFVEVAFQLRAKEDPRLLAIWNNRGKNLVAFDKAVKAVAAEFKQTYTVRQDPQLAENQRAVKASQQSMATTTKENPQEKWAGMTADERQREVQRMIRMG